MPGIISIEPTRSTLVGRRATRQLLASVEVGSPEAGSGVDLTRVVRWASLDPAVAVVSARGVVTPRGEGSATIVARLDTGTEARAVVRVSGMGGADRVSYRNDVMAAFSRAGCNMGACHGTPTGKGGSASASAATFPIRTTSA